MPTDTDFVATMQRRMRELEAEADRRPSWYLPVIEYPDVRFQAFCVGWAAIAGCIALNRTSW